MLTMLATNISQMNIIGGIDGALFSLSIASAVVRAIFTYGLTHIDLTEPLIMALVSQAQNVIEVIRTCMENDFILNGEVVGLFKLYAWLTEYKRAFRRVVIVFGFLLDVIDDLGMPMGRAQRLYMALREVLHDLLDLHEEIERRVGLNPDQNPFNNYIG